MDLTLWKTSWSDGQMLRRRAVNYYQLINIIIVYCIVTTCVPAFYGFVRMTDCMVKPTQKSDLRPQCCTVLDQHYAFRSAQFAMTTLVESALWNQLLESDGIAVFWAERSHQPRDRGNRWVCSRYTVQILCVDARTTKELRRITFYYGSTLINCTSISVSLY